MNAKQAPTNRPDSAGSTTVCGNTLFIEANGMEDPTVRPMRPEILLEYPRPLVPKPPTGDKSDTSSQ